MINLIDVIELPHITDQMDYVLSAIEADENDEKYFSSLRKFFDEVNYNCKDNCSYVRPEKPETILIGCCHDYPCSTDKYQKLIKKNLNRRQYTNKNGISLSRCVFHGINGCGLPKMRPAACIGYLCDGLERHIRENFGINLFSKMEGSQTGYWNNLQCYFSFLLDRSVSYEDYENFKHTMNEMTERVRNVKSEKNHGSNKEILAKLSPSERKIIENYLECEKAMNGFFSEVGYCREKCVRGVNNASACCMTRAFLPRDVNGGEKLLHEIRLEKYGLPIDKEPVLMDLGYWLWPCNYHTLDGCMLVDFKSPICLSYACDNLRDYLKNNFNIDYPEYHTKNGGNENTDFLISVLDGTCENAELTKFVSNFKDLLSFIRGMKDL